LEYPNSKSPEDPRHTPSEPGGGKQLKQTDKGFTGQAQGGESGDSRSTAFIDADFHQLRSEIGRTVAVGE
jgi:hypothetical protein